MLIKRGVIHLFVDNSPLVNRIRRAKLDKREKILDGADAYMVTHMDNVAHASLTRYDRRGRLAGRGVTNYGMPQDGETVLF